MWAEAESSRGVRRIEIVSTRGDLEACGTPNASWNAIPCRTNISKVTYVCDFPASPRSARCESRRFLSVASLVTYSATVTDASGRKDTTEPITYSGGPFSGNVFARPVYWHTNFPTNPPPREKIDIGYFPDPDYGSAYGTFADDVGNSVSGIAAAILFNDSKSLLTNTYSLYRRTFNVWAGPFGADAFPSTTATCGTQFDANTTVVCAAMDGSFVLHQTAFRDCATSTMFGAGAATVWARGTDRVRRYVHESGHALFGLGDEYCCFPGARATSDPPNIHANQADCVAAAPASAGRPANACRSAAPASGASATAPTKSWPTRTTPSIGRTSPDSRSPDA